MARGLEYAQQLYDKCSDALDKRLTTSATEAFMSKGKGKHPKGYWNSATTGAKSGPSKDDRKDPTTTSWQTASNGAWSQNDSYGHPYGPPSNKPKAGVAGSENDH